MHLKIGHTLLVTLFSFTSLIVLTACPSKPTKPAMQEAQPISQPAARSENPAELRRRRDDAMRELSHEMEK